MPKYFFLLGYLLYTGIGFFNDTFLVDKVSSMTKQVATRASCQLPCARRVDIFT